MRDIVLPAVAIVLILNVAGLCGDNAGVKVAVHVRAHSAKLTCNHRNFLFLN